MFFLAVVVFSALVLLLAIIKWPGRAMGVFLLLTPFNYFYVIVFGWQVSWQDAGGVSEGAPAFIKYGKDLVFLGILLGYSLAFLISRVGWRIKLNTLDLLVGLFLGYQIMMVVPAATSLGLLPSLTALWQNIGFGLSYFLIRFTFSNIDPQRMVIWVSRMLLIGGLVALIGIWQFFYGASTFQYVGGAYIGLNRAFSTLGQPNNLGMYLGFLLVTSVVTYLYRLSVVQLVATLLMVICLVLTVSMSSLFGTLIGTVLILVRKKEWKSLLFTVCLAALGMVLIVSWLPGISERIGTAVSGGDEAWVLRLVNWKELWPPHLLWLLLGTGGGTGGSMTISFHEGGGAADSQYVALLIQFGVVGLVMYVGLLIVGTILALRRRPMLPYYKEIRMASGAVVILTALFGGTVNVLNAFPANLYFWCALALIGSVGKTSNVRSEAPPNSQGA